MELESLKKGQAANGEINWVTAIFMGLFHVGAIAALFFFTWKAFLFVAMFLWWVSGSLGIGMGYHRLLTHRGYKTPKWVEYFLTVCATLALEGGPIFWVATHRIHHQYSDQEGDPHSPIDGKWWAHMGWILMGKSMHHDTTTLARYVPDLAKDKFHVWITKVSLRTDDCAGIDPASPSADFRFCCGASFLCAPWSGCTPPGW
jgi:fatty-acid desaturase